MLLMINIPFSKKKRKQFITKNEHVILQDFAVTANAGFRREVFEQNGVFDTEFESGEDMDLYFRMLHKSSWKGIYDPKCKMYHQYRSSFSALMKQWIWYGKGHPKVFCRFGGKGIHLYYPNLKVPKTQDELKDWDSLKKLITIPFYKCGFIALTPFNFFLMSLVLTIISKAIAIDDIFFNIASISSFFFFCITFFNGFKISRFIKSLQYSFIRFCLNWCFVITGLIEGIKMKTIFLDVSFERSTPELEE